MDILAKELIDLLRDRGETISTSESLTGGLLSSMLTDVPGASAAFLYGNCCYTYEMKEKYYGLMQSITDSGTAVTEHVVTTMARSVRELSGSDYALATTGLAGPDGDGINPIGTFFIAFASAEDVVFRKFYFPEPTRRKAIKMGACDAALNLAISQIHNPERNRF